MINYFPSYLPFGIPENEGTMLNGIIAPLIIHAVWATTQRHNTEWKKARDKFRQDNEYNKAMLEKWCALSDEEKEKAKRV